MPASRSFLPWFYALAAAVCGHLCLLGWLAPGPPEQRMRPPTAALAAAKPAHGALPARTTLARAWRVGTSSVAPKPAAAGLPAPGVRAGRVGGAPRRQQAVRVATAASPVGPAPQASAPIEAVAAATPASAPRLKLPPAERLQFIAQRGTRSGHAELRWERAGAGGYELLLVLRYDGQEREALIQSSRGDIGESGLQPRRYADRRGDAGLRSVNFDQEDEAAPSASGAQDRLSWLVQLAAMAAAWTEMPAQGTHIVLPVAGARGERDDWVFEVMGLEPVPGAASLLHLSRAPLHRHDHRIDMWLDAPRSGWPVRMSWSHPARETLVFVRENAMQQR